MKECIKEYYCLFIWLYRLTMKVGRTVNVLELDDLGLDVLCD